MQVAFKAFSVNLIKWTFTNQSIL